jgi:hypothetical protein
MTRIGQILADFFELPLIRAYPPNPRHPRSILSLFCDGEF